jgi:hypothetical protein
VIIHNDMCQHLLMNITDHPPAILAQKPFRLSEAMLKQAVSLRGSHFTVLLLPSNRWNSPAECMSSTDLLTASLGGSDGASPFSIAFSGVSM